MKGRRGGAHVIPWGSSRVGVRGLAGVSSALREDDAGHEADRGGRTLAVGETRLKSVKRIVGGAATKGERGTAAGDMDIPRALMKHLGHMDCGVYAEVIAGGEIAEEDGIEVLRDAAA